MQCPRAHRRRAGRHSTREIHLINMADPSTAQRPGTNRRFGTEYEMTSRSAWLATSLTLAMLGVPPGSAAAGDAVRGAKLAYTCHGCHGIPNYKNAYPVYSVPKLGGQHAAYLVVALKEYAEPGSPARDDARAGRRRCPTQDLQDVAALPRRPELKPSGRAVGTAPKAAQTCVACHGNDGVGILPEYPNLAGQHADYLAQFAARLQERRSARTRSWPAWRPPLTDAGHQRAGGLLLEASVRASATRRPFASTGSAQASRRARRASFPGTT